MGFYLSIIECVHRFELVHRYTPRYLAEFLPIIVMYPAKIVEKSDFILKSLESLEPWRFFVYHAQFLFAHVGKFSSLEKSINHEIEKT